MEVVEVPPTGTREFSTLGAAAAEPVGSRSGTSSSTGRPPSLGTPGARHWLANLREHPEAVLHLREPASDLEVVTDEVTDPATRRHVVERAWRLQPWYAAQPYSMDDWVSGSPMVTLTPLTADASAWTADHHGGRTDARRPTWPTGVAQLSARREVGVGARGRSKQHGRRCPPSIFERLTSARRCAVWGCASPAPSGPQSHRAIDVMPCHTSRILEGASANASARSSGTSGYGRQ